MKSTNKLASKMSHSYFGKSIEVNPLGETKICTFDCVYCDKGPSQLRLSRVKFDAKFPTVTEIVAAVGSLWGELLAKHETIETLIVSGNGEPTLHPQFPELLKALSQKRIEFQSKAKIVVYTNGDQLSDRDIVSALNGIDERVVKIDVGTEASFKLINRPLSRSKLEKVIHGSRTLKDRIVQAAVVQTPGGLTSQSIDEWLEIVGIVQPKSVILHPVVSPMTDPGISPTVEDEVHRVVHLLDRKLRIKALVSSGYAA